MPADFPNRVTAISSDAVSESLLAVPNSNDPLRVAVPCQIVDATGDYRVFSFCAAFTCGSAIPDANNTSAITRGTVVARWGEASDCCGCCVASILSGEGGIVDGAEENRFVRLFA